MPILKTSITPIFDNHQFLLRVAKKPRQFANLSNRLDVDLARTSFTRYIEINSFLFTILRRFKVSRDSEIELFLEADGNKLLFGMVIDNREVLDLWHYTRDQLPWGLLS